MPNPDSTSIYVADNPAQRAQIYALLATLLNRPPDVHYIRELCSTGVDELQALLTDSPVLPCIQSGLMTVIGFIETAARRPEADVEILHTQLAGEWTRLFRGISPDYGPQPPYEGLYRPDIGNQIEVLQKVDRMYRRMRITLNDDSPNRLDYLGVELGALSMLAGHEADAGARGEAAEALRCSHLSAQFMDEHLGRWVGGYITEARRFVCTDYYSGVLLMIEGVVSRSKG